MGVLNVTPDSFSDGGLYLDVDQAVRHALKMVEFGADILDIGGESTRPATFHDRSPLDIIEELSRIIPVIDRIVRECPSIPISVDTYKAAVAKVALDHGASVINDISGLTYDPEMADVAARAHCPLILMHILGSPRDMGEPKYVDVVEEIKLFLRRQIDVALAAGVESKNLVIDPGIGFGKNTNHNLTILRRLSEFKELGVPILIGPSRKRFIGQILKSADPADRIEGTAAAVAIGIANGADIVRVHDVQEMSRVVQMADAIVRV